MVKRDDYIGYAEQCTPDFGTRMTELPILREMGSQLLTRIVGITELLTDAPYQGSRVYRFYSEYMIVKW